MLSGFITFEGIEGSGKSSQIALLSEALRARGLAHVLTREPGGTPAGESIRGLLLDSATRLGPPAELLLYAAARAEHLERIIRPALAIGRLVLCDRYLDATRAYQGYGRGVPLPLIDQVDRVATGGRTPDRTLLFDLAPDEARARGHSPSRRERGAADRLDGEALAFYERVRRGFLELARSEPERFRTVDSSRVVDVTQNQVRAELGRWLGLEVPV